MPLRLVNFGRYPHNTLLISNGTKSILKLTASGKRCCQQQFPLDKLQVKMGFTFLEVEMLAFFPV